MVNATSIGHQSEMAILASASSTIRDPNSTNKKKIKVKSFL